MKFSKDELRTVARMKGWKGGRASKDDVMTWLNQHGVDFAEIGKVVQDMRRSARGQNVAPVVNQGLSEAEVNRLIAERASTASVDMEAVRKMIFEAVSKAQPARVILNGADDKKPVTLKERTHPQFEKVLQLVNAGMNVLLVGPAGCGKTTMAHQVSKALKRKYGTLHCTSGASESQLTGWLLPIGSGKNPSAFSYVPSEFVRLYEEGDSVFLLDEIDAADPNMMLVINGALANGSLHVQQRYEAPHVKRGKNVAIIAAANTYGTGADTMYAGRNQLDAATLDRFYVVEIDYDKELEREIAGEETELLNWVWQIRDLIKQNRLRRVASTRMLMKAIAAKRAGIELSVLKRDLLAGWTRDELNKIGVYS